MPPGRDTTESHLEQHFRKVFRDRVKALGATVKDIPWPTGNRLQIGFPGATRVWTLDPQEVLHGCRPDFVLRSNDPNIPPVAVFTDGRQFHASLEHNRLADDATKRRTLREHGIVVLAVTARDVESAAHTEIPVTPPSWFRDEVVATALQTGQFAFSGTTVESLTGGPFAFLLHWIQKPAPDEHTHLADVVPLFFLPGATPVPVPPGPLAAAAAVFLDDPPSEPGAEGTEPAFWWRAGPLGVLVRVTQGHGALSTDLAVVIDDRDDALTDPGHDEAWREWLRISNALTLRTGPMSITTVSQALTTTGADAGTLVETEPAAARTPVGETARETVDLPPEWRKQMANAFSAAEVDLLTEAGRDRASSGSRGR